jgi:hypothetical protein
MIDILLRGLLLTGGITIAVVFIGFGLFFFGWVFSRQENGW